MTTQKEVEEILWDCQWDITIPASDSINPDDIISAPQRAGVLYGNVLQIISQYSI
jgi:hypothetical protein